MGLLQKALETYNCHEESAGKYMEDQAVLAPVGHTVTRADLEIVLDTEGNFCSASAVDKKEPKILIPVTVGSAGRSGKVICAHPLCDQLSYLSPCIKEKYEDYLSKLTKWSLSEYTHPKIQAVLGYVKKGCILKDLEKCGLVKLKKDGTPEAEKLMVRWRILNSGEDDACWKDQSLLKSFTEYDRFLNLKGKKDVCMVSGDCAPIAVQHPKGVVAFNGNAKLISANDSSGFTYRGRFTEDWQAVTVGYETSQKAHNALRWLIADQGSQIVFGGRTFLCWNPQGQKTCTATGPFMRAGKIIIKPTDYRESLQKTLLGYQSQLPEHAGVVIAAFDAATSGRLSLTYYNELLGSDFLQRLYDWELHCAWPTRKFGVQSPSLYSIVSYAYGTLRKKQNTVIAETEDAVMRQQIQRLLSCRIDKAPVPYDFIKSLMRQACSHLIHEDGEIEDKVLSTTCATIRKYRYDRFKEEWNMALEPEKKDISYQYGRLLAVLEKVERDTYDRDTDREPNAIRQQSVFCQRPMYAAAGIEKQLERAYFPRLKTSSRIFYKNLIGEIMEMINSFPESQWNKPLKETYLMGYYLQRSALYTKKEMNLEEKENG